MKIIPTWTRANLPTFNQMALQDHRFPRCQFKESEIVQSVF